MLRVFHRIDLLISDSESRSISNQKSFEFRLMIRRNSIIVTAFKADKHCCIRKAEEEERRQNVVFTQRHPLLTPPLFRSQPRHRAVEKWQKTHPQHGTCIWSSARTKFKRPTSRASEITGGIFSSSHITSETVTSTYVMPIKAQPYQYCLKITELQRPTELKPKCSWLHSFRSR